MGILFVAATYKVPCLFTNGIVQICLINQEIKSFVKVLNGQFGYRFIPGRIGEDFFAPSFILAVVKFYNVPPLSEGLIVS